MTIELKAWKRGALTLGLAAGVLCAWGGFAAAHRRGPRALGGHLTTEQVECASLCTRGVLTGDVRGKLDFTMSSMDQTDTPNVARYQGMNLVTTAHGTLGGPDYGVWNLGTGQFVDFTEITVATGVFAGMHGSMSIAGVFDPVSAVGASDWRITFSAD